MRDDGINITAKMSCTCQCINVSHITADTVSLEFIWPGPAPRGGQFFLVKPRWTGVFLGRPISAAGWKPGGILRFFVTRHGQGSREITELRSGEDAKIIGPLGNSWAQVDDPMQKTAGPVALVGGGTGIASLLMYAQEQGNRPFDFYAGFKTASYGLEDIKPRSLVIATEDGSLGLHGQITEFFSPLGYSGVFACGPEPMLKMIGDVCITNRIPCFISLERHMACGVGACLGCTVRTTSGNRTCCSDGPIFDAQEVCFDK